MTEELKLIDKLKKIEALFAGATLDGEKDAAQNAIERIQKKLSEIQKNSADEEFKFSLNNSWSKKLFIALLRRYGLKPYRYRRQRYTTVMVKVPASFVNETLWPEFQELNQTLTTYLESTTERIISECIFSDSSETILDEMKSIQ